MRAPRKTTVRAIFFALLFLAFTCVYPYMAWVNNPNENVRTYMTMALVEGHTLSLEDVLKRHGWTNDMALVSPKVRRLSAKEAFSSEALRASKEEPPAGFLDPFHSTHYSVKAPAVSLMGVPVYYAYTKLAPLFGKPVPTIASPHEERLAWLRTSTFCLRLFVVGIPSFLFLLFLERKLRRVSKDEVLRLSAVAACGVGTNYLAYALMYVSHTLFAVTAFASFVLAMEEWRDRPLRARRVSRAFLAGFFATFSTLLEYHAFPITGLLCLLGAIVFLRPTRLLAFGVGAAINVIALMAFQWASFGNPLTPGHRMMENPAFASVHAQGLFGMESPDWLAFREISLSKTFGFFGISPYMFLGFLALVFGLVFARGTRRDRWHTRRLVLISSVLMGVLWITVSAAHAWRGGWTIGPRYLGAAPPFFALLALIATETFAGASHFRRWVARIVAGGLAAASVLIAGTLSMIYNSLPEPIGRPIPTFAIPALRTGFVPHHAGEWIGLDGFHFFYVVYAAMLLAVAIAIFRKGGDRPIFHVLRVAATGLVGAAGFSIAFAPLEKMPLTSLMGARGVLVDETEGAADAAGLFQNWEPKDRDRISKLKLEAERYGSRGPCTWHALADLERIVHWEAEALRAEQRAGAPRSSCPH